MTVRRGTALNVNELLTEPIRRRFDLKRRQRDGFRHPQRRAQLRYGRPAGGGRPGPWHEQPHGVRREQAVAHPPRSRQGRMAREVSERVLISAF